MTDSQLKVNIEFTEFSDFLEYLSSVDGIDIDFPDSLNSTSSAKAGNSHHLSWTDFVPIFIAISGGIVATMNLVTAILNYLKNKKGRKDKNPSVSVTINNFEVKIYSNSNPEEIAKKIKSLSNDKL